ncbi:VanZ family protein [Roseateles chitosanitabidus]|jgi:VanZ family protein|uniref:VanZ family protein n=1 Tax=Roseateles chitosanitabidus TaxID=65048 RepID=UPI000A0330F4|nr:VanZ family protein [Roseateles chitosanitabidus]MBO9686810.1 VanZ family protein [Roseateles chitosanitabidus]
MSRRSSATWLALCYAVLVVYASLYPFWPWRLPPSLPWPGVVGLPWPRYWGKFDIWINVVGYWPLGLLCFAAVIRSGGGLWRALVLAVVGLPLLSFSMETLQYFLPGRVPSLADFLLNSGGAWAGALCGWALYRFGGLERWDGWRERWFVPHSAGALALLALWPIGLLYPAPLPLGLGQLFPRLREWAELLLADTPWELVPRDLPDDLPLPPGLEAIAIAMGLLAPCLLALSVARPGRRRILLVLGALLLGILSTAWSTLLNFGPDHAWAWLTPTTTPGLAIGGVLALLAALMSRRASAAWGLVVLTALIALVAEAPSDPYLTESLQFWEQGRFVNMYGLAQWVGWVWPFAALAWLLYGVTQSDPPPTPPTSPPTSPPATPTSSPPQAAASPSPVDREEAHDPALGGNPETTIAR